ncbi:hypothetical protein A5675_24545 [Mycobacterium malmoense]|uniref:glycosyltransferase family 87 protein n=1 Tax=Mycobacterium malmoense TaxID=1780 RepID=UPI00080BC9F0|nr:glycosyltransferase family 87 protein [Mycobacterium malmoense]OCB32368.1 hypothetical protein A5675_24545 [Mycobacterium malmoense]
MSRALELLRAAVTALREQFAAMTGQSARTILLGTILLASAISGATGFVLTQYFSVDVLSSILYPPQDCWLGLPTNIGRHCFNDYTVVIAGGMRPNPWDPFVFSHDAPALPGIRYPPAGMVPQLAFGLLGKWLGAPRLGLLGYLLVLSIAVLTPAVWAGRGARGLERIVVFVACGAVAVPAWFAVDRGNSVGFVVPIALVFLVALCRQRWGLVTIMVVLAALVKPQFAVLGVALLAGRQWRLTGAVVIGGVVTNLAAYLLWPRDFPQTIVQSAHNLSGGDADAVFALNNVSIPRLLLVIPDLIAMLNSGGKLPAGFLAGPSMVIGRAILALVAVSLLALGRRIPPVMAGIVLLATASLSIPVSYPYYLVFALPIAALVVRDPDGPPGSGIFDRLAIAGGRRRAVGIWVSLAAALSIAAPIALPIMVDFIPIGGEPGVIGLIDKTPVVPTSATLNPPLLWLIACAAIIVSYARRPVPGALTDDSTTSVSDHGQPSHAAASQRDSD